MATFSRSPSSSAVTIPIPGKSILKRPQAQSSTLFSRITRFLPSPNHPQTPPTAESKPLKRAHFILPQIATVYPISSVNPPSTPTLKEEKKAIEDKEAERRRRIVRGGSSAESATNDDNDWWSLDKVESFYRECCAGTEEEPDPAISFAFKNAIGSNPRSVDYSGVQLTISSASILSDVFTIEWGLRKLVFRECDLDEHTLKPILHALLIPNSLTFLSVASNRRLRVPAFRLLGAYLAQANTVQFLDISQNPMDKKSVEYITAALPTAPTPGLISLRMDDCSLRPAALEALARAVRTSSLRNISLRHNRITATGAVPLAFMIRDYPDVVPATTSAPPSPSSSSLNLASQSSAPTATQPEQPTSPPAVSRPPAVAPPPPRNLPAVPQTTYTPYIPRSRRGPAHLPVTNPLSPTGQHIPIITSSSQGGVTTRHPAPAESDLLGLGVAGLVPRHDQGPSAALLDKVRALDALPRLGALRTLDLRGNDLRGGVVYIAQVLKRNRTLKVLNLSENKLDVQCLVAIAEALKYNSCLETLDLSKNPCSGPSLEGIQSLRTAFTLNTALKRLFLSATSMTSSGAIALAEFLPESTSLLHLDLTMNSLDIAGVMALSSGLKANHTMRCLDLNIPPGDEEFAKMCRDILNSCVRNTEEAEKSSRGPDGANASASGRGLGKGVWGMIEESELAKTIRQGEEQQLENDVINQALAVVAKLKRSSPTRSNSVSSLSASIPTVGDPVSDSAKTILLDLAAAIQATTDPLRLEELLEANDQLTAALAKTSSTSQLAERPTLTLHGLGLRTFDGARPLGDTAANGAALEEGVPHGNGQAMHGSAEEEDPEVSPNTPKIDKGKARAVPEPEQPQKVLSPTTFMIEESDEDDEDGSRFPVGDDIEVPMTSPTNRSKIWVEEEGEVFRKGTVLLGPKEMEGDYAGEELRRELLEAMVERPPPRPLDELALGDLTGGLLPTDDPNPTPPTSPLRPEAAKPAPRRYMPRSRSSSSSPSPILRNPISSSLGGEEAGVAVQTPTL